MRLKFVVTPFSVHCVASSGTLLIFNGEGLAVNYRHAYPLSRIVYKYDRVELAYDITLVNLMLSGILL